MTMPAIDRSVDELVNLLIDFTRREIDAAAAENTPAVNRNAAQVAKWLQMLKSTPKGRAALEALMVHPLPEIRLRAANAAMSWAPDQAIPVLGLLVRDWRPVDPRKGYIPVAFDASVSLFKHFNLYSHDEDDLVEPLARYGIKLERRR